MIEAQDVSKRYGSFLALDGVSFSVERGQVCGFLGLNGAGKTTFIRLLSCFMPPSQGAISVSGFDTVRASEEVRRRIGYLPERVPLYEDLRIGEFLKFRARLKGVPAKEVKAAVDRVADRTGLQDRIRSPIGTLSKGYRQRVGIADALVHSPELLILDEPTSGLDPDQRREMRSLITELGEERTVFLSTHILPEAEAVCSQVIIVHQGVIRSSESLRELKEKHGRHRLVHSGAPLGDYAAGEGVETRALNDGNTEVFVTAREQGSRAVAAAVGAGRDLLEMSAQAPDLEAIFIRVTTGRSDG